MFIEDERYFRVSQTGITVFCHNHALIEQ